jgi:hypothetical protein
VRCQVGDIVALQLVLLGARQGLHDKQSYRYFRRRKLLLALARRLSLSMPVLSGAGGHYSCGMAIAPGSSEQSSEPSGGSPRRRWLRWFIGGTLVTTVTIAALIFWRLPITGAVLRTSLDWVGFSDPCLTVTDLTLSRFRLAGIRLGSELDVASADIAFELFRPGGPALTRLSLGRTRLDLTDPAGPLRRRLDEPASTESTTTLRRLLGRVASLPRIEVEDVALRYPVAGYTLSVSGFLTTERSGAHDYRARYKLRMSGGAATGRTLSVEGTALVGRTRSDVDAQLSASDGTASGRVALRAIVTETDARFSGNARITVDDMASLSMLSAAFKGAGGQFALSVRTLSAVTIGLDTPLDRAVLEGALRRARTAGLALDGSVRNARYGTSAEKVDATVSAVARAVAGPTDGLRVDGAIELRAGRVRAGDAGIEGISLRAPLRLDWRDGVAVLTLPEPARATAARVTMGPAGAAVAPLVLSLSGGRPHAVRFDTATGRAEVRGTLATGAATLRLADGSARRIDISPVNLRLNGTQDRDNDMRLRLRMKRLGATERDKAVVLDDLEAALQRAGVGHKINLRGRVSVSSQGRPFLAPVDIQSALTVARDVVAFDGRADAKGAVRLVAKGRHDLGSGRGGADVALKPVRFQPGQTIFRSLLPGLSDLGIDITAGTGGGNARLWWDGSGVDGTMAVRLDGLMITHGGGSTIEGLSASVRLDRLMPPRSPPGQTLRIKRIAAGVVLNDLIFQFGLIDGAAAESAAVRIDRLTSGLAGGTLMIRPTVLRSSTGTNQATIDLSRVDLATLLGLLGIDGVSGTGRLSGAIPLRQDGQAVGIDGGLLAAEGPGVLKIRSAAVKKALAQGGADVILMLDALENFYYETLTLTINKAPGGDGRILLSTRGHNPAVRDSQPFVINLTVSGNVDRLAAVAAQALQLPGALVRSMIRKAP